MRIKLYIVKFVFDIGLLMIRFYAFIQWIE